MPAFNICQKPAQKTGKRCWPNGKREYTITPTRLSGLNVEPSERPKKASHPEMPSVCLLFSSLPVILEQIF